LAVYGLNALQVSWLMAAQLTLQAAVFLLTLQEAATGTSYVVPGALAGGSAVPITGPLGSAPGLVSAQLSLPQAMSAGTVLSNSNEGAPPPVVAAATMWILLVIVEGLIKIFALQVSSWQRQGRSVVGAWIGAGLATATSLQVLARLTAAAA
jgi:hypothetical protein